MTPTVYKALALYDAGQQAAALRVAGSKSALHRWLSERASAIPPLPMPKPQADRVSTRRSPAPSASPIRRPLAKPDDPGITYKHRIFRKRGRPWANTLDVIFRTVSKAACETFGVCEQDILQARGEGAPARLAWVCVSGRLAVGVVTNSELAAALDLPANAINDLVVEHLRRVVVDKAYALNVENMVKKAEISFAANRSRATCA